MSLMLGRWFGLLRVARRVLGFQTDESAFGRACDAACGRDEGAPVEAVGDELLQLGRVLERHRWVLAAQNLHDECGEALAIERTFEGAQLVQHAPQRLRDG